MQRGEEPCCPQSAEAGQKFMACSADVNLEIGAWCRGHPQREPQHEYDE